MYLHKSLIKLFKTRHWWCTIVLIGNTVKCKQLKIVYLFNIYKKEIKTTKSVMLLLKI